MYNRDLFGRDITYLRVSVTDLCNLRCRYCMPETGICKKNHTDILRFEEIIMFISVAAEQGVKKVRLTGGEPLIRKDIVSLVREIKKIDGIEEITMTTNGVLLELYAYDLKLAGLDRVNISIDSLNPLKYKYMTRGGDLTKVLRGVDRAKEVGLTPIKINTVLIGGFNDMDIDRFMDFSLKNTLKWRLIELMPIGEVNNWSSSHFINGKELMEKHPDIVVGNFNPTNIGNVFKSNKTGFFFKLINSLTGSFCATCNRLRLTSDGLVKPCLHSNAEYDIKPFLDNKTKLTEFYRTIIMNKPKEHHILDDGFKPIRRNMNRIGG